MKTLSLSLFISALLAANAAVLDWESKAPVIDPVAFVRSMELAEPTYKIPGSLRNMTRAKLGTPPDKKKEGYVVGGGLVAFTENVMGISKQDIMDATLFAQLAADKNYDRERDTVNWYSYYKYVLANIGFVIQNFGFQQYKATNGTLDIDQAVLQILAAIATGNELVVITETLNALRVMADDDKRIVLFSQQSYSSASGNFQVYPCDQSPSGEVSVALGGFYFNADHHEVRFLFFGWRSTSIQIYKGTQTTVLNQSVYAKVRSDVSAKLGENAVNLVASIDLL